jgi:hypothetical protein
MHMPVAWLKEFVSKVNNEGRAKRKITAFEKNQCRPNAAYFFFCLRAKVQHHSTGKSLKITYSQMWPIRQDWQLSKHQIDIGGGGNQTGRRLIFADNFFRGCFGSS